MPITNHNNQMPSAPAPGETDHLLQPEQVAQLKQLAEARRASRTPASALTAAERLVAAARGGRQAGAEQLVSHQNSEHEDGWPSCSR